MFHFFVAQLQQKLNLVKIKDEKGAYAENADSKLNLFQDPGRTMLNLDIPKTSEMARFTLRQKTRIQDLK